MKVFGRFILATVVGCSFTSCSTLISLFSAGGGSHSTVEQSSEQTVNSDSGTKTIVTPDGKHVTIQKIGSTTTTISSDGKVSTYYNHGNGNGVVVNPDGSHTIVQQNGSQTIVINSNGTHTIVH